MSGHVCIGSMCKIRGCCLTRLSCMSDTRRLPSQCLGNKGTKSISRICLASASFFGAKDFMLKLLRIFASVETWKTKNDRDLVQRSICTHGSTNRVWLSLTSQMRRRLANKITWAMLISFQPFIIEARSQSGLSVDKRRDHRCDVL